MTFIDKKTGVEIKNRVIGTVNLGGGSTILNKNTKKTITFKGPVTRPEWMIATVYLKGESRPNKMYRTFVSKAAI